MAKSYSPLLLKNAPRDSTNRTNSPEYVPISEFFRTHTLAWDTYFRHRPKFARSPPHGNCDQTSFNAATEKSCPDRITCSNITCWTSRCIETSLPSSGRTKEYECR